MKKIEAALLATTLAVGLALAGSSAYAADLMAPSEPGVVVADAPAGYISVFAGGSFGMTAHGHTAAPGGNPEVPFNTGYLIGGALGTNLMPNLRGEVELSYASHGVKGSIHNPATSGTAITGSSSTLYILGNLWYDIDTGSSITPYLGGGLGVGVVMPNISVPGTGDSYKAAGAGVAGQLGAGIKFDVADNVSIDLGYRAKGVWNASLKPTNGIMSNYTGVNYIEQTVQVGLDIGF